MLFLQQRVGEDDQRLIAAARPIFLLTAFCFTFLQAVYHLGCAANHNGFGRHTMNDPSSGIVKLDGALVTYWRRDTPDERLVRFFVYPSLTVRRRTVFW